MRRKFVFDNILSTKEKAGPSVRRPGHQSVDGMSVPTGVNWAGLLTAIVHPMSTAWIGATNIEHAIGFGAAVETYFADLGGCAHRVARPGSGRAMGRSRTCSMPSARQSGRRCSASASLPTRARDISACGLYAARQVQKTRLREGQPPERSVVEGRALGETTTLADPGKSGRTIATPSKREFLWPR